MRCVYFIAIKKPNPSRPLTLITSMKAWAVPAEERRRVGHQLASGRILFIAAAPKDET